MKNLALAVLLCLPMEPAFARSSKGSPAVTPTPEPPPYVLSFSVGMKPEGKKPEATPLQELWRVDCAAYLSRSACTVRRLGFRPCRDDLLTGELDRSDEIAFAEYSTRAGTLSDVRIEPAIGTVGFKALHTPDAGWNCNGTFQSATKLSSSPAPLSFRCEPFGKGEGDLLSTTRKPQTLLMLAVTESLEPRCGIQLPGRVSMYDEEFSRVADKLPTLDRSKLPQVVKCVREQRTLGGDRFGTSAEPDRGRAGEIVNGCLVKFKVSLEGQAQLQGFLTERAVRRSGL